jgi:PIN domain nuclease of toxin-antitoxin system
MAASRAMILDTCALLWLAGGDKRLSRAALREINGAAAVYVSAISGFEIAIKAARGKLKLPIPPQEWFEKVVEHHGLTLLPLDLNICIAAAQLPPIHEDPCDRFILSTAIAHDLAVVTRDEQFEPYGVAVIR